MIFKTLGPQDYVSNAHSLGAYIYLTAGNDRIEIGTIDRIHKISFLRLLMLYSDDLIVFSKALTT